MEFSALAKILIVFSLVLAFSRIRVPLGLALIGGGLGLEFWAGRPGTTVGQDFLLAAVRPELWLLLINIALILEVGYFMAGEQNAQAIINAARRLGGSRGHVISLILIPAAIGLVPMPGGALFSAPLVGKSVQNPELSAAWKAAVNYWFRHVLEYWWPLYPVVIVTLSIFTLKTWQFMAVQIPFTFISIAVGYFFLLRSKTHLLTVHEMPAKAGPSVFKVLAPILLIVACTLVLPIFFQKLLPQANSAVWKLLSMLVGLLAALVLMREMIKKNNSPDKLFQSLLTVKTGNVLFTLAGVMAFQSFLDASGLLPLAGRELASARVSVTIIITLLPFLAGLVTGIAVGFAGAAFPLVIGLMEFPGAGLTPMATLVLAFSMGYAGMMLSPVHLCFVLTREYFSASIVQVYRIILPCVATIMVTGVLFHFLLLRLGL